MTEQATLTLVNQWKSAAPDQPPIFSVCLVSPDQLEVLIATITHLRNQTIADQLEVVIIIQEPDEDPAEFAVKYLSDFRSWAMLLCEPTQHLAEQQTLAIHHATAPLVALGEDHCQPDTRWAEEMVKAYAQDEKIAGVSPAVCMANTRIWAYGSQLIDYNLWTGPAKAGDLPSISTSNASYRRDLLVELYGDGVPDMIRRGSAIHHDLISKGYRFVMHPDAKVYHKNISRFSEFVKLRYTIGRFHAGHDLAGSGVGKRALMAVVSMFMPLKRFAELHKKLLCRKYPITLKISAGMAVGLMLDGVGRVVGCVLGEGSSLSDIYQMEFKREPRMLAHERGRDYVAENNPGVDQQPGYLNPVPG